jgi:hypothetical protein
VKFEELVCWHRQRHRKGVASLELEEKALLETILVLTIKTYQDTKVKPVRKIVPYMSMSWKFHQDYLVKEKRSCVD